MSSKVSYWSENSVEFCTFDALLSVHRSDMRCTQFSCWHCVDVTLCAVLVEAKE